MDPSNTLARALSTADMILEACDIEGGGGAEVIDMAAQLAEDVQNLHEWLIKGGFMPAIWEANRPKVAEANVELAALACQRLIGSINATGGVRESEPPDGLVAPVADEDWVDLGDAYMLACAAVGATPMKEDDA